MLKIHSKEMGVSALFCTVLFFGFTMGSNGLCTEINEVETERIAVNLGFTQK
ncbi:MAG: hypothetical protein SWH54_08865 [Thermodesulfobacteriota bacterium]|nr:hypothetical protein [Thermodesulfobacteriota bacterium]